MTAGVVEVAAVVSVLVIAVLVVVVSVGVVIFFADTQFGNKND